MKLWASLVTTLVLGAWGFSYTVSEQEQKHYEQTQQQMQQNAETIRMIVINECLKTHPQEECLKLVPPAPKPGE